MTWDENSVVRSDFTGLLMDHTFVESDALPPIRIGKRADVPVNLSIFVQVSDTLDENTAPEIGVTHHGPAGEDVEVDGVEVAKTQRFRTRNAGRWHPRRWHVALTLPAELAAGDYQLRLANAATLVVLESDALEIEPVTGLY